MNFDNRKSHIALEKLEVFQSIPDLKTQAQKPKTPTRNQVRLTKRKRNSSPVRITKHLELHLPQAVEAGVRAHEYVETKSESPWKSFQKVFELKMNDLVTVATRQASPCEIVVVKPFETRSKLDMLQQIRHENFAPFLEAFEFQECFYAILQHITISLTHIVVSPPYPTQSQLAAILGQILQGLTHLTSMGLVHGSLTCSNILLTARGIIKITNQENCTKGGHERDLRALGYIAMELMQKYPKEGGAIGVDDLVRWPSDSPAVCFLSDTTSATSLGDLIKHPLISSPWRAEELKWVVEMARISVHRGYKYRESFS